MKLVSEHFLRDCCQIAITMTANHTKDPWGCPLKGVFVSNVCYLRIHFLQTHWNGTAFFISLTFYNSQKTLVMCLYSPYEGLFGSTTTAVIFCPTQGYNFLTSFLRFGWYPAVVWRIMKITITYIPIDLLRHARRNVYVVSTLNRFGVL